MIPIECRSSWSSSGQAGGRKSMEVFGRSRSNRGHMLAYGWLGIETFLNVKGL
jgi:hypothetical protein